MVAAAREKLKNAYRHETSVRDSGQSGPCRINTQINIFHCILLPPRQSYLSGGTIRNLEVTFFGTHPLLQHSKHLRGARTNLVVAGGERSCNISPVSCTPTISGHTECTKFCGDLGLLLSWHVESCWIILFLYRCCITVQLLQSPEKSDTELGLILRLSKAVASVLNKGAAIFSSPGDLFFKSDSFEGRNYSQTMPNHYIKLGVRSMVSCESLFIEKGKRISYISYS